MSKPDRDLRSAVAAMRAETRARLVTLRLEREAARDAFMARRRAALEARSATPSARITSGEDEPDVPGPGASGPRDALEAVEADVAEGHSETAVPADTVADAPVGAAIAATSEPGGDEQTDAIHGDTVEDEESATLGEASFDDAEPVPDPAPPTRGDIKLRIRAAVAAMTPATPVAPILPAPTMQVILSVDPLESVMNAAPEPAAEQTAETGVVQAAVGTPLDAVAMLGPGLTRRLQAMGITSAEALAGADAQVLARGFGRLGGLINLATLAQAAEAACRETRGSAG